MKIEIGQTPEQVNTQYAPLAVLLAHYQQNRTFRELQTVQIPMKTRTYPPPDKLMQVMISMLAGCETVAEVNSRLRREVLLARVLGWERFADQSSLSRTLDRLSLKQIEALRQATTAIWRAHSQVRRHDWRGYLWLDFDLSGLPCSPRAEASQKGFFSDKKTPQDDSWPGSVRSPTGRRSGRRCSQATATPAIVCNRRSKEPKLL